MTGAIETARLEGLDPLHLNEDDLIGSVQQLTLTTNELGQLNRIEPVTKAQRFTQRKPMSAFKKGMEMHAMFYAAQARLDVVSLRIASIYGPLYYSMHNPISRMCHAAVTSAEPDFSDRPNGALWADDQGDWTYVKDVARGIQMVHTAERLQHRIYNIGSGRVTSHQEILAAVQKAVPGARCAALRPGHAPKAPVNPAQDLSRIKADVGYEPEYTIETGIAAYVEWLRSHPQ